MSVRDVHITTHPGGGWQVKIEHVDQPVASCRTQKEAITAGREYAKKEHSELIVHGKKGKIRDKISYGNDPRGTKG